MFNRSSCVVVAALLLGCQTQRPVTPDEGLPRFVSDPALAPASAVDESGQHREVGRLVGPSNKPVDFVLDEVLLTARSRAEADAVAARWKGSVVGEAPLPADAGFVFRLRVDPTGADVTRLPELLRKVTPASHGEHRASSARALQLLALATQEAADHQAMIGLNFLFQSSEGVADGKTSDGVSANLMADPVFKRHNLGKAWQVLEATGHLTPQITAAIMDSGFVPNPDLPTDTVIYPGPGAWLKPNGWGCGGSSCPWHGTDVASAFAGQLDNGYGAAGPAGPVTKRLVLVRSPDADLWQILDYLFSTLPKALGEHPRIINISATLTVPGFFGFLCKPAEWAFSALRHGGTIVFAAAGNKGEDVDEEDCFIACWEADVYVPCELDDVVCVGGVESLESKDPGSNFGRNQRGTRAYPSAVASDNSVDLFGPYTMAVGPTADSSGALIGTGIRMQSGTSFASPFVAGVAALVWAAKPDATADQVVTALIDTARPFGGAYSPRRDFSGRMVDAYAAVKPLVGNVPPRVSITTPANGSTHLVNPQGITFQAVATDWEDPELELTWSSDVDGALGTGSRVTHEFATLGPRVIQVVARDSQGASATASITVTVSNTPPQGTIAAPLSGEELTVGVPVQLSANTGFAGNAFRTLTCTWTSSDPSDADFPRTGCLASARFSTIGARSLALTIVDQYGTSTVSSVNVTLVPPGATPTVTITSPAAAGFAAVNDLLVLDGTWVGGIDPSTFVWRWQSNQAGCPEVDLATTTSTTAPPMVGRAFRLWDTSTVLSVPNACGYGDGEVRLYVTDSFGRVGQRAIAFRLNYQPGPR